LVSLATQKFITDVTSDCFDHCKNRHDHQKHPIDNQKLDKKGQLVLRTTDVSRALGDWGVKIEKNDYFLDKSDPSSTA